jgi:DNA polymerase-3 subunit delta'
MPENDTQHEVAEMELLPWTREPYERILGDPERQAHAYLLTGQAGLGKSAMAEQLAKALLCPEEEPGACGHCQSCRIFKSGSHPDLHVLQSDKLTTEVNNVFSVYAPRYLEDENIRKKRKKPSADIRIDQVRAVIPDINTRPQMSRCRVIVVNQAEDMNVNAANSLLKSLEEPPPDTYFLLISHEAGRLVPTIRSRCNRVDIRPPDRKIAVEWLSTQLAAGLDAESLLDSAAGLPLLALAYAQGSEDREIDLVQQMMIRLATKQVDAVYATRELLRTSEPVNLYTHIQKIISGIIRQNINRKQPGMKVLTLQEGLIDLGNRLNFRQLYAYLDMISTEKRLVGGPLDETLAMEESLINWQQMFQKQAGST